MPQTTTIAMDSHTVTGEINIHNNQEGTAAKNITKKNNPRRLPSVR